MKLFNTALLFLRDSYQTIDTLVYFPTSYYYNKEGLTSAHTIQISKGQISIKSEIKSLADQKILDENFLADTKISETTKTLPESYNNMLIPNVVDSIESVEIKTKETVFTYDKKQKNFVETKNEQKTEKEFLSEVNLKLKKHLMEKISAEALKNFFQHFYVEKESFKFSILSENLSEKNFVELKPAPKFSTETEVEKAFSYYMTNLPTKTNIYTIETECKGLKAHVLIKNETVEGAMLKGPEKQHRVFCNNQKITTSDLQKALTGRTDLISVFDYILDVKNPFTAPNLIQEINEKLAEILNQIDPENLKDYQPRLRLLCYELLDSQNKKYLKNIIDCLYFYDTSNKLFPLKEINNNDININYSFLRSFTQNNQKQHPMFENRPDKILKLFNFMDEKVLLSISPNSKNVTDLAEFLSTEKLSEQQAMFKNFVDSFFGLNFEFTDRLFLNALNFNEQITNSKEVLMYASMSKEMSLVFKNEKRIELSTKNQLISKLVEKVNECVNKSESLTENNNVDTMFEVVEKVYELMMFGMACGEVEVNNRNIEEYRSILMKKNCAVEDSTIKAMKEKIYEYLNRVEELKNTPDSFSEENNQEEVEQGKDL